MNADAALFLISDTLKMAALIAAPVLISCMLVGLIISIFQVVTQIQEMTLTFVPKVLVAVVVILVCGHWMLSTLITFSIQIIKSAANF